jgi:hypothetical protein
MEEGATNTEQDQEEEETFQCGLPNPIPRDDEVIVMTKQDVYEILKEHFGSPEDVPLLKEFYWSLWHRLFDGDSVRILLCRVSNIPFPSNMTRIPLKITKTSSVSA